MDVCTENDESGFEATGVLKARFPKLKVIIVTSMLDPPSAGGGYDL